MQQPTPGSHWRHYKSDGTDFHTYEVIGVFVDSETHEPVVVYRPLYTPEDWNWVKWYMGAVRRLSLWYDIVEHVGKQVQRFTEIER